MTRASTTVTVPVSAADEQRRFAQYRQCGDRRIRDAIVGDYQWLVRYCARRFAGRGEPLDDLVQVGQLGLLKAIERYDPEHGSTFAAFATPTLFGELKRHFRDKTWPVRLPRRASDLLVTANVGIEALSQSLGRSPTIPELARFLRVPEEDLLAALDAGEAYRSRPLTGDGEGREPERGRAPEVLGVEDAGLDANRLDVRRALQGLTDVEQRVVYLRFYEGMTQSEIAAHIGTSQVSVSRCLRRIYAQLEPIAR